MSHTVLVGPDQPPNKPVYIKLKPIKNVLFKLSIVYLILIISSYLLLVNTPLIYAIFYVATLEEILGIMTYISKYDTNGRIFKSVEDAKEYVHRSKTIGNLIILLYTIIYFVYAGYMIYNFFM